MGRAKKMVVRRPLLSPRALAASDESRASLAVTVGWMLTLLATAGAGLLAIVAYFFAHSEQLAPQSARLFSVLSGGMLVSANVTGILCLVLTVVVYYVRRDPPPISITVAAVFVSTLPLATMLLLALR